MCEGVSSEVTDLEEIINNDYFIICVEVLCFSEKLRNYQFTWLLILQYCCTKCGYIIIGYATCSSPSAAWILV